MDIKRTIRKNEIYTYDFGNSTGSIQNGVRPVLVIQGNDFNKNSSTTIIAPITTAIKKTFLPSHVFLGKSYGLLKPSMAMLEQIRTVNQADLGYYVGTVDDDYTIKLIWKAFKKTVGMWDYNQCKKSIELCLCSRCLSDYKHGNQYIISRGDPFRVDKDLCTVCNMKYGYVYRVVRKNNKE